MPKLSTLEEGQTYIVFSFKYFSQYEIQRYYLFMEGFWEFNPKIIFEWLV